MRRWVVALFVIGAACSKSASQDPTRRGPTIDDAPAPPVVIPPVPSRTGGGEVLTAKNDNGRTGANLAETVLDPSSVRALTPVGSYTVDGELYAQPLVAAEVATAGGAKNLLVVATMNNTVYAFDADANDTPPLWQRGAEVFGSAVSSGNFSRHGILGTPVIDREKDRVFVVARSCDDSGHACKHTLAALALATGDVLASTVIAGSTFDSNAQWQRPALLLHEGRVYVAFGAGPSFGQHEEDFVFHGWVFGYDGDTLAARTVFCTTPRGKGGGIWQAGAGLAADDDSIYFVTGNSVLANTVRPPNEYSTVPRDQEDSVVKLPISGDAGPKQYWDDRPYTDSGNVFQFMEANDVDFGSSAPLLIPSSNVLVSGAKSGIVYTIDRSTMRPTQSPLSAFTALPLQPGHTLYIHSWWGTPVIYGSLVYWQPEGGPGLVYGWAGDDRLTSFRFDPATSQLAIDKVAAPAPIEKGGCLSVSANGGAAGILWATSLSPIGGAGHLWAFDAKTLERLVDLDTPAHAKFVPPTIAQGKVFVATAARAVAVYGLKSP